MKIHKPKRSHRILGLCNNNKLTLVFPDVWCSGLFPGTVLLSFPPQKVALNWNCLWGAVTEVIPSSVWANSQFIFLGLNPRKMKGHLFLLPSVYNTHVLLSSDLNPVTVCHFPFLLHLFSLSLSALLSLKHLLDCNNFMCFDVCGSMHTFACKRTRVENKIWKYT